MFRTRDSVIFIALSIGLLSFWFSYLYFYVRMAT
ncbi:hypothetical protein OKW46_006158 [Paraburkholderia sp. WSM4179]|nr:hypothetical protein [Paraburkholderia sp. WSM4179]